MKQKLKEQKARESKERKSLKTSSTDIEMAFLHLLKKRKQLNNSKYVFKMPERWEKEMYDSSMENVIIFRLRLIKSVAESKKYTQESSLNNSLRRLKNKFRKAQSGKNRRKSFRILTTARFPNKGKTI